MKTCTACQQTLLFTEFHKDASRKDGRRDRCKSCVAAYMQHNYVKNKDVIVKKVNAWVEKNRERHNEKCARWVKNNPHKVNARTAKRYAAKKGATPAWLTEDDRWMIAEAYQLARLRSEKLGVCFEVDHIVPLRGKKVMGLHVPWNLQVVERVVNRQKSNAFEVTF